MFIVLKKSLTFHRFDPRLTFNNLKNDSGHGNTVGQVLISSTWAAFEPIDLP